VKSTDLISKPMISNLHYEKGKGSKTLFGGIASICLFVLVILITLKKYVAMNYDKLPTYTDKKSENFTSTE